MMFIKLFAHKKGGGSTDNGRDSNPIGKDDTLFALVDGTVKFERVGKDGKQVSVYPVAQ